jgi:urease accessory protein UreE
LIAKQMGLRHLPAQVKATDVNTLSMLKEHGERIAKFEKPLTSAQKLDWLKQVRMPRSETQISPSKSPNLGYR